MVKVQWHWTKDNDYPQDGEDVWCVINSLGFYIQKKLTYSNNLYELDEFCFEQYKDTIRPGFYSYDSEYMLYEVNGIVCWTEMPQFPSELE